MFTIVEGVEDYVGSNKVPKSNKIFVDGEKSARFVKDQYGRIKRNAKGIPIEHRPYLWKNISRERCEAGILPTLYKAIKNIDENDLPHVIIAEDVIKYDGELTRLSVKDGYLENSINRTWIQLDIDGSIEGSKLNTCSLDVRVERALEALPFLRDVGIVAHLSNKAGLSTYADYFALRLYVELDTPTSNKRLKKLFEPYKRPVGIVDTGIFTNGRQHLVQRPELQGSVQCVYEGERVLYRPGKPLCLDSIEKDEGYVQHKSTAYNTEKLISGVGSLDRTSGQEILKGLQDMAHSGELDGRRYNLFYEMVQRAHWTNQNEDKLAKLIVSDPKVLGDHPESWVMGMKEAAIKRHQDYFRDSLWEKNFDTLLADPKTPDLKNADLNELFTCIDEVTEGAKKFGLIVKSPHGSSKTSTIVPEIIRLLEQRKGSPLRVLYISTLRSIIRSTSTTVGVECYISDGDYIDKEIIDSSDKLGIGLRSLHLTHKTYDFVIVDESEQVGYWAETFGNDGHINHNRLIDLLAFSTYGFALLDADAGALSWSMLDRARKIKAFHTLLLNNSTGWIAAQSQQMIVCESPLQLLDEMCTILEEDSENRVFLHTDIGDKNSSHKLKALEKAVNQTFGKEIFKTFSANSPRQEKVSLTTNSTEYIQDLFDKGIRGIGVSPIIVSGWRPQTTTHFTHSFGYYQYNILSAPTILQRMMRPIYCKNHYIYLPRVLGYSHEHRIEDQIIEDVQSGIALTENDAVAESFERDADAIELKAEAAGLVSKHKSNVPFHLKLLFHEAGGSIHHLEALDDDEIHRKEISELLNDNEEELNRQKAVDIYEDADKNEIWSARFVDDNGKRLERINDADDMMHLLEIFDTDKTSLSTARELYFLLTHNLEERETRIREGWEHGLPIYEDETDLREQSRESYVIGFSKVGQVLDTLIGQIDLEGYENILDMLFNDKELIIDTAGFDKKPYGRVSNNYSTFLGKWFRWYRKGMAPNLFLANLFEKELQCGVTREDPQSGRVVEAKNRLWRHYVDAGLMKSQRKGTDSQKLARKTLLERVRAHVELSDTEEECLRLWGGYIKVERPAFYTNTRWLSVHRLLERASGEDGFDNIYEKIS